MLDPEFIHRVQPPESAFSGSSNNDSWYWKLITCLIVLLNLWGLVLGYDQDNLVIVTVILIVIMFQLEFKLDDIFWRQSFEKRSEYNRNWLCLKCDCDWVEEK